jgi:hypothetical protein
MESSALVRRYLAHKAQLDADKVLERQRPAAYLREQRTAYTLLELGIQAPAFIAAHLADRARYGALGTPEAARSTFFYRDESLARRLALAGQGAAYLAAHAAERAQHDALGTPEGERGSSYRLDARMAAQVQQQEQQRQQQRQHSARGAEQQQQEQQQRASARLHVKGLGERKDEALRLHLARLGQSTVIRHQRLAREAAGGGRGAAQHEDALVATLVQAQAQQQQQQQQQLLAGGSPRQSLRGTLLRAPLRSVPTSPLSHWVGESLPLASWRDPGANTLRIMGPSELTLCRHAPVGGSRGEAGSGGRGGSGRGSAGGQCCCGWAGCQWDREQKESDTHRILLEHGHVKRRPGTPW